MTADYFDDCFAFCTLKGADPASPDKHAVNFAYEADTEQWTYFDIDDPLPKPIDMALIDELIDFRLFMKAIYADGLAFNTKLGKGRGLSVSSLAETLDPDFQAYAEIVQEPNFEFQMSTKEILDIITVTEILEQATNEPQMPMGRPKNK